jgi:hypothetical protein
MRGLLMIDSCAFLASGCDGFATDKRDELALLHGRLVGTTEGIGEVIRSWRS